MGIRAWWDVPAWRGLPAVRDGHDRRAGPGGTVGLREDAEDLAVVPRRRHEGGDRCQGASTGRNFQK